MNSCIVITGTDTDIGKTVFSAGLTALLGGYYWKPVQAGLAEETDSGIIARLGQIPMDRILPETYRLNTPVSPHRAAEIDGVEIDPARLEIPNVKGPLIIEGAGGLMVPLTRNATFIDVFSHWQIPVVLCARTALGTINHSLLSIEALRSRNIPLLGVAFIGDEMPDTVRTIAEVGEVRVLGRLPFLAPLTAGTLIEAMKANFDRSDFIGKTT